jgi:hypothetical protein
LKRSFTRVQKAILQAVLKEVFELFKRIASGHEVKSVVCSELVYRCFDEASPKRKYALTIRDTFAPLSAEPQLLDSLDLETPEVNQTDYTLDAEYQEMFEQTKALFEQFNPQPITAASIVAPEMVSPRDLERSPNLTLIGRLCKES